MSDHNKCPSSEKEDEKCIFRLSYFHRIEPMHGPRFSMLKAFIRIFSKVVPKQVAFTWNLSGLSTSCLLHSIHTLKNEILRVNGVTKKAWPVLAAAWFDSKLMGWDFGTCPAAACCWTEGSTKYGHHFKRSNSKFISKLETLKPR